MSFSWFPMVTLCCGENISDINCKILTYLSMFGVSVVILKSDYFNNHDCCQL